MTFLAKKKKKKKKKKKACCSVLGTPFLALSFGGGAVTEVLHALQCGLALSPVRHDLPKKKKKVLELRWTAAHPVPLPTEGIG